MTTEVTGRSLTYVETDLDVYRITIFENEPIAAGLPRNWTVPTSTNHTVSLVAAPTMPSGKAIRLQKTAGNRSALLWTPPPVVRDASAVGLFRTDVVGLTNMGLCLRVTGGDGTENGYFCRFDGDAQLLIFKSVAGTGTTVQTAAFAHGEGENLWMRFDALNVTGGVLLRGKAWRGNMEDEPESFVISFTEVTNVFNSGGHGIFATTNNTPDYVCGLFRVRSLFSQSVETLRFTKSSSYLPVTIDAIQSLLEVQVSPGAISLGENLGERATITAAFKDHKHADLGEMYERGTFWGKFRGREIFRRGEPIRMIRGLLGQSIGQMETRHYVLDSFSGPSFSGAFQLIGKDPLKLADDDRALAPRPNSGFLIANVLAADTTLTLSPGGIGNTEYPSDGYVAIGGKEIVSFVRRGNDSFTKVLLPCDGTNGSTTFTDTNVGGSAHTWTAAGNAQISTAQFKFGGASALFDGTGDTVTTPDSVDFTLGASNFSIDCWFFCTAPTGVDRYIAGQVDAAFTGPGSAWDLSRNGAGDRIRFEWISGGSFVSVFSTSTFTNLVNTGWHHVEATRSGTNVYLFIDGVLEGSAVIGSTVINDSAAALGIGCAGGFGGSLWIGNIDQFRLSVGVARHVDNFVLPTGPYSTSGDVLTIARAKFGTLASDHQAEDRVQVCLLYTAKTPAFIISDLFINYADILPAYVPTVAWELECDSFLDRLYTKMIADPTGVQELVSKLIQQAGLAMWWEAVSQEIRLQVLRGVSTDAFKYDQTNVLSGTMSITEQPDKRITQVWTYYGVRNPLSPLDQQDNFRSGLVTVDLETELLHGGSVIKTIYADWIPAFGRQTAQRINDLQIGRFKNPPRRVTFETLRYSGVIDPELGGGFLFDYWGGQNEVGDVSSIPIQVTRLNPMADRFVVEAEEMLFSQQATADLTNRVILFDGDVNNVNLKNVHDSIYPTLTALDVTNGVNLTVIVGSGVVIGSATSGAAFNVGTGWPVGLPITIQNMGTIAGRGGNGGNGHIQTGPFGGTPGTAGTTALLTIVAINLDNTGGTIGGGGGGGAGGGFHNFGNGDDFPGGGGGGGAGLVAGNGGLGIVGRSANGSPGTLLTGGAGGGSISSGDPGGNGGNLGSNGVAGTGNVSSAPGAAGAAVDGISHVTVVHAGTILGAQIN